MIAARSPSPRKAGRRWREAPDEGLRDVKYVRLTVHVRT